MTELAKPIELIKGIVADLKIFSAQCGDVEDMNKEIEKAKHNLEVYTHNVKIMKLEFGKITRLATFRPFASNPRATIH